MDVIVGTAGHIDHGKTALIKALTGIDADRLPEEKRRGITVDLGFAEMRVSDVHFGFVDVPGHERFVKNMLAGAIGIDLVLLVIAADEGVMPQTREHFDICRLLGVHAGVVVLTKTDLVDVETLELAKIDAAELVANSFLENAPMICVSVRTGEGIDTLKDEIGRISANLPARDDRLVTRLPVDRSFSIKGFGAVVTGTLASGEVVEGAEMELLPTGTKVRVRSLQTHGRGVKSAFAGQRVAVNLGGIDHSKIMRGMVLAEPNTLRPTQIIDAAIEVLPSAAKSLRSRQRVRVHIGTIEALARIQVLNAVGEIAAGSTDLAQIRLEMPVVAVPGVRFIVRSYSPQATIAGGQVLDTFAEKHRRKELDLVRLHLNDLLAATANVNATVKLLLNAAGTSGLNFVELQMRTAATREILKAAVDSGIAEGSIALAGDRYIIADKLNELSTLVESAIGDFHRREPLAKGISREALRESISAHLPTEVFLAVISALESSGKIVLDKEVVRQASYEMELSAPDLELSKRILTNYMDAGLEVPKLDEAIDDSIAGTKFTPHEARKFFQLLIDSGKIVKVTAEFYFAREAIENLVVSLRQFADKSSGSLIDVAQFKELAGISRKYAIPLLEYFDRERITSRAGDKRIIL